MNDSTNRVRRPHVVIVGGGFGGIHAARALRRAEVQVILIDRHVYNQFQPLLYQVATAALNAGDVTYFLRSARSRQHNLRFLNGEVRSMDHVTKTLVLSGGQRVRYDYLVIAAGVTANFFGVPGAAEYAMPLYERSQALAVRDRMLAQLEDAAINFTDRDLRIVVVGDGATGVETAGAFAELRNNDLPVTYPELAPEHLHVTLVEMTGSLLGPFHPSLRDYAHKALQERGVDLRLNTAVNSVRPDGVVIGEDHTFLPAQLVIWASGVTVRPVVADWNVPQGRGGRILVDDHLRVQGLDSAFAVGDIAVEQGDRALPQLAQPAIQGGRFVGRQIRAATEGKVVRRFRYHDKGIMATIGRSAAVAQISGVGRLKGSPAWAAWVAIHVYSLLGNRNRLAAVVNLGAKYLFWQHSHNAIVGETPPVAHRQRQYGRRTARSQERRCTSKVWTRWHARSAIGRRTPVAGERPERSMAGTRSGFVRP